MPQRAVSENHRCTRLLAIILAAAGELAALNPRLSVHQYQHTAWTESDGAALPEVRALVQDGGGYLWLGTSQGLYRFDGLRFTRWEKPGTGLPIDDVFTLAASSAGGIWAGSHSAVWRIRDGEVHDYPHVGKQLGGGLSAFVDDGSGGVWVLAGAQETHGAVTSIAKLSPDGKVRIFGRADGIREGRLIGIAADFTHPGLWLLYPAEACQWSPGSDAGCRPYAIPELLPAGRALHGALTTGMLLGSDLAGPAAAAARIVPSIAGALRDAENSLWAATFEGLLRFHDGRLERLTAQDGLSGGVISTIIQDTEGDIWVGTNKGIDRFRNPVALHVSSQDGLESDTTESIAATSDGAVWVGAGKGTVDRILGSRITPFTWADRPGGNLNSSLYADRTGGLWVGTMSGLFHRVKRGFEEVTAPEGDHLERVDSISGDASGEIWVADENRGLLRVRGRSTEQVAAQVPLVFRVMAASDGTIWGGSYRNGLVAVGKNGAVSTVLHDGPTFLIYEDRAAQVWVGMGASLSRLRNGRWTTWGTAEGLPDGFFYGMAEDDRGDFWVLTGKALLRLQAAELNQMADGAPAPLHFRSYGLADGLHLASRGSHSQRIVKAADGRIWFCETTGVGIVDPAALGRNEIPPQVHIEQLQWNGKPAPTLSFQAGEVHIAYSGISLAAPHRVRFKYRLEPNRQWIDAGSRRDVTYASLRPGRYRFRVAACNLDGVWNEGGAAIDFRVEPYLYQTAWFALACAAGAVMLGFAVHRWRVHQLTARFQLVAQERARVTREIHDSLLQGFTGVVFQLEAAARQFHTQPEQSKRRLEFALDRADQAIREARGVLSTMRLPALEHHTLPDALAETGDQLTRDTGTAFHCKVEGRVEPLRYELQVGIFLIGREAIANAVQHAAAARIEALLVYTEKEFRLGIQDDGAGFDPVSAVDREGHWGLRSMRERAGHLGAEFSLQTAKGKGTRIEVRVRRK